MKPSERIKARIHETLDVENSVERTDMDIIDASFLSILEFLDAHAHLFETRPVDAAGREDASCEPCNGSGVQGPHLATCPECGGSGNATFHPDDKCPNCFETRPVDAADGPTLPSSHHVRTAEGIWRELDWRDGVAMFRNLWRGEHDARWERWRFGVATCDEGDAWFETNKPLSRADEPIERAAEQPSATDKDCLTAEAGDALEMLQHAIDENAAFAKTHPNGGTKSSYLRAVMDQVHSERARHAEELERERAKVRELDEENDRLSIKLEAGETWLSDLIEALGWQGGTIHNALAAVRRLASGDKDAWAAQDKIVASFEEKTTRLQSEVARLTAALDEAREGTADGYRCGKNHMPSGDEP
jgi:hypothetical protein